MKNEEIIKAWGILIRKDEIIETHGKKGKKDVKNALSVLTEAKSKNPFVLYDLGYEDKYDVALTSIGILKNKKGVPEDILKKASEIYKKIEKSESIRLYEDGIKKFSSPEILKAIITFKHYFNQEVTIIKHKRAKQILDVSGMFFTQEFFRRVCRDEMKSYPKVRDFLVRNNIIYNKKPFEIISKKNLPEKKLSDELAGFIKNKNLLKRFVKEISELKKIKKKYRVIKNKIEFFRSEGQKKPFFLFFKKRKKWTGDKEIRKKAGIAIYEYLENFKGVFDHSNLFKGINFSGITSEISEIRILHSDFGSCNFSGIVFENCDFRNCSFKSANLSNVVFFKSNLSGADFSHSNLLNSQFSESHLNSARFDSARMNNSRFDENCKLGKISFIKTNLSNISVSPKTHFKECDFSFADLNSSNIRNTSFTNCIFFKSKLTDIFSIGSDFSKSSFNKADLRGCKMNRTNLSNTNFRRAVVSGGSKISSLHGSNFFMADLSYATIENAELNQADFLGCNLYMTSIKGSDFKGTKHISGTEQKHIAIGEIAGQEVIHRATIIKKLRDIGTTKDKIHYGSIELKKFAAVGGKVGLKKLCSFFSKNGAVITKKHICFDFLNSKNLELLESWMENELPDLKSKIIELVREGF